MSLMPLMEGWIGTVFTGMISFSAAWILRGIDRNIKFKEKKLDHSQDTISHLTVYIENWRRLISISELAQERGLSQQEDERLSRYVNDRDHAKSELVSCIKMLPLFFDENVVSEFEDFRKWDGRQSTLKLPELPHISEWEKWQFKLCRILKKANMR